MYRVFPPSVPRKYIFPKWKKEEKERTKKSSFSQDSVTIDRYVACKSFRISSFKKKKKKKNRNKKQNRKRESFSIKNRAFFVILKSLSRWEFLVRLDFSSFSFFFFLFLRDFDRSYEIGTNRNELECVWGKYWVSCWKVYKI